MIPTDDGSRVAIFSKVFADIGDEQSIEQSLSTFSSHMVNIVNILSVADGNSLVLIDELGAGTDPVEGAALATAILERLHMQGAKVAATTHYAELKEYALSAPRVENGSCEFDVNTLRPTYRLILGIPGRSNAFAISERLGIDGGIINRAKELVSTENTRFEDVVDRLTESRLELEKEREKAQEISKSAEEAKERAQKTLLEADGIIYVERVRRKSIITCFDGTYETPEPLEDILVKIKADGFVRCHNSYVVNLKNVFFAFIDSLRSARKRQRQFFVYKRF